MREIFCQDLLKVQHVTSAARGLSIKTKEFEGVLSGGLG